MIPCDRPGSYKPQVYLRSKQKAQAEALRDALLAGLDNLSTKTDLDGLRGEVKTEIVALRGEVTLVKWMLGLLLAGVVLLVIKTFFA